MKQQRTYRGFKVLHRAAGNGFRIKVLAQNDTRYIVLIHRYLFGIKIFSKSYVYEEADSAQQMFEKFTYLKILPFKPNLAITEG